MQKKRAIVYYRLVSLLRDMLTIGQTMILHRDDVLLKFVKGVKVNESQSKFFRFSMEKLVKVQLWP